MGYIFLGLLVIVTLTMVTMAYKVVQEGTVAVVERLGAYYQLCGPGLHFIVPFIDRVKAIIKTGEQTTDIKKENYVTLDDQKITLKGTFTYRIQDAKLFVYGVQNVEKAINNLLQDKIKTTSMKTDYKMIGLYIEKIQDEVLEKANEQVSAWGIKGIAIHLEKLIH